MIPIRLLILQRIQQLLEQITTIGQPDFDPVSMQVFRGRIILGADIKPLPVLSIMEAPRPDANSIHVGEYDELRQEGWTLLIQGLIDDDIDHPTDNAYYLEAAVEEQLSRITATNHMGLPEYEDAFMLGGLITKFEIGPPIVRPPENNVSATGFFFLPVRVGVVGELGKPYTTA